MRLMPRLLWLLFGMSVVTMLFVARCGINMDSQLHAHNGMPSSSHSTPGEKALREVMRRKEVEHIRDRTILQEKIKTLESQLAQVQDEVKNLTNGQKSLYLQDQGHNDQRHDDGSNINRGPFHREKDKNNLRFPIDGLNPVPYHVNHGREPHDKLINSEYFQNYAGQLPRDGQIYRSPEDSRRYPSIGRDRLGLSLVDRHALGVDDSYDIKSDVPQTANTLTGTDNFNVPDGGIARDGYTGPGNVSFSLDIDKTFDYQKYFHDRLDFAEILKGQSYKTEYELIPFNRFVFNRIYMVEPGLGKRVVEKPIGSKKRDLHEIMFHALETLNKKRSSNQYVYEDFVEGIYRTDPASGSQYELYFVNRDSAKQHSYVKITVARPFAPPLTVQHLVVHTGTEWINIILPLSKRVDTFRLFMEQFVRVCIKQDKRVYLTVVYFGQEGLNEVKTIMGNIAKVNKFKYMKLITLNETFARGRGLQIGALNWKGGSDVLLFFCDVDIVFTYSFLERCRLNSDKGQRVYYPIVFSLYNPKIVYSLQDLPMPSFVDQLILSKDTGFWRDFGYGMACLYRSDFLKIKGFDEEITGWGGEDVFLYQKFVRSDYFVVRATDPAIFHLWHEKVCAPSLTAEQYRSCIRSKALNEASHAQLGLLAFKDEIDIHRAWIEGKYQLINSANINNNERNGSRQTRR